MTRLEAAGGLLVIPFLPINPFLLFQVGHPGDQKKGKGKKGGKKGKKGGTLPRLLPVDSYNRGSVPLFSPFLPFLFSHAQDEPDDAQSYNSIKGDVENNTLFDTPGGDKIEGLDGDDIISVSHGGKDWVSGGAGADDVMVRAGMTDDVLIEGNAGADMLTAGGGDDRIFCEDKGEMADLVEAGETADGLDIWGDHANGRGGDDYIYGSAAKDLLVGGLGNDLVSGGGGDDALFGDGDAIYGGAGNNFISNGFSLTGTSYN